MGRAPIRFVNHAESATSSALLTFGASSAGSTAKTRVSGRKIELSIPSHASGETYTSGAQATCFASFLLGSMRQFALNDRRSVSVARGARRGKSLAPDAHDAAVVQIASPTPAMTALGSPSEATVRPQGEAERIDLAPVLEGLGPDPE